ncbi:MAG: lysophospholipid acyltransferase family protein [Planctomycetia bacterium]|nr:lysophospholipid acyltransferase family protein [Planctomycetia bacterium]
MKQGWFQYFYYNFWCYAIRIISAVYFRIRYNFEEEFPREGKVVLVANHQSFLDPPLIGIGLPRQAHYMARDTLFRGLLGWHISHLNAYPISRDKNPVAGIKETLKRLKHGEAVLIFPEGTRSEDGELQPFHAGIIAVAKRSGAPIVPCAIDGAHRALPRKAFFPLPRKIVVKYGKIITPEEIREYSEEELLNLLSERVAELFYSIRNPKATEKKEV